MACTYLIDFENTTEHGFDDIKLTDDDVIYCFFTRNNTRISLPVLSRFQHGILRFVETPAGRNALDAVLSSYLGYLLAQAKLNGMENPERTYVVVSRDGIYDAPIAFWNESYGHAVAKRVCPKAFENEPPKLATKPKTTEPLYVIEARKFVAEYSGPANVKMALCQKMIKKYGQKDGLDKYKTVRGMIWCA